MSWVSHYCVVVQAVLAATLATALSAPAADPQVLLAAKPYINQGSASGPLTPGHIGY